MKNFLPFPPLPLKMSFDYSSNLLISLSSSLESIKASQAHHLFLPISFLTLIHASRVSHATTTLVPVNTPLLQSTTFALILLFGGVVTATVLLAVPSPILLAPWTIAIYGLTHIVLTKSGISNVLLNISRGSFGLPFDIFCHAIDGICRSEGITLLGVESVRRHSNQAVANSPFAALVVGTLIGGGAPLLLSTFTLTSPNWTLRTPLFLTSPTNLLAVDIWSATFISFLYMTLTTPGGLPSLLPSSLSTFLTSSTSSNLSTSLLQSLRLKPTSKSSVISSTLFGTTSATSSLLDHKEAHIICAITLFVILALNRSGRPLLQNGTVGKKTSGGLPKDMKLNGWRDSKTLPSVPVNGSKKKGGK